MSVSTEERLETSYVSAMLSMSMEPQRAARQQTHRWFVDSEQVSRKSFLDALSAGVFQEASQTTCYRWKGLDTLNRGNPFKWIEIQCMGVAVERLQRGELLLPCIALRSMLEKVGPYKLETTYLFRNHSAVRRYLELNPELVEVLLEARQRVQHLFGASAEVILEVVNDPEVMDSSKLFAYIRTPLPIDQALDRLQALDDDWFLSQLDRVGDLFNLNLEYP